MTAQEAKNKTIIIGIENAIEQKEKNVSLSGRRRLKVNRSHKIALIMANCQYRLPCTH